MQPRHRLDGQTSVRMLGKRHLWRDVNGIISKSKNMSKMQLQYLERRLDRDAVLRAVYLGKISDKMRRQVNRLWRMMQLQ